MVHAGDSLEILMFSVELRLLLPSSHCQRENRHGEERLVPGVHGQRGALKSVWEQLTRSP